MPSGNHIVRIDQSGSRQYCFLPNPMAPSYDWVVEGRFGVVYAMAEVGKGSPSHAVKVLRRPTPTPIETRNRLARLRGRNGFLCAEREWLEPGANVDRCVHQRVTLASLSGAVWMPWLNGRTWAEWIQTTANIDASSESTALSNRWAYHLAHLLADMERDGIAHGDISGPNVFVDDTGASAMIELVDLEDVFIEGLPPSTARSRGLPGYSPCREPTACHEGDRVAGAVLVCEMLAWSSSLVRKASEGDAFFESRGVGCPAANARDERDWELWEKTLRGYSDRIWDHFVKAWMATTLKDAPPLSALCDAVTSCVGPDGGIRRAMIYFTGVPITPTTPTAQHAGIRIDASQQISMPASPTPHLRIESNLLSAPAQPPQLQIMPPQHTQQTTNDAE